MKQVLIATKLDKIARDILEQKGFTVVQDADRPLPELAKAHPGTQALIVRSEEVSAAVIDLLPNLRVIVRAGAGYDTIDIKYARRKGIDVMNTPGANANAVAEEVLALVLAHYRFVVPGDVTTRQGLWEKKKFMGRELAGKTLGIVGLGNVGQLVARRAAGFEVEVLGYDPLISPAKAEDLGVKLADLETIFRKADIVTLHVPETDETRGMVNRRLLGLMKPGATLVNCARAGIVNEADLRALRKEKKLGFCTDVYPEDEPGPKTAADVADVMLPHLGASTHEANWTAAKRAAEQLVVYVERGVTRYVVNRGVPDDLDEGYQQVAYHAALLARHFVGLEKPVRRIECSFHGGLDQYAKWFLSPVVAGVSPGFDALEDSQEAEEHLKEKGIAIETRPGDEAKRYGKSITVELTAGTDALQSVSVRGTVTEGLPMISRVNDFDRLYLHIAGHSLIVVYADRPGVLARITGACADAQINIEDIRAPYDQARTRAMAILKTNRPVPADVVARIRRETQAETVFALAVG